MIMKRIHRLAGGKFGSEDLKILEKAFDLVAKQPSFDPNEYSAEGFAVRLIALYQHSLTSPCHLEKSHIYVQRQILVAIWRMTSVPS